MPGDARTCEIACDLRPAGGSIDRMGILRYIVQGFGWELGARAARESLDAVADATNEQPAPTPASERERRRREKRQARQRRVAARRAQADIEAQLRALKKHARK